MKYSYKRQFDPEIFEIPKITLINYGSVHQKRGYSDTRHDPGLQNDDQYGKKSIRLQNGR